MLAHWIAWPDAPFDEVVERGDGHDPSRTRVVTHGHVRGVRAECGLGRRRTVGDDDKWFVGIPIAVQVEELHGVGRPGRPGVTGGQDAPVHRRQMRREQHLDVVAGDPRERLLDLRCVPMIQEAVGGEVLVDGAERVGRLRWTTGARHPARGVDDDAAASRRDPTRAMAPTRARRSWDSNPARQPPTRLGARRGTTRASRRRSRRAARARRGPRRTRWDTARRPAAGSRPPDRRSISWCPTARGPSPARRHEADRGRRGRPGRPGRLRRARTPGRDRRPARLGYSSPTRRPAWVSAVAKVTSNCGMTSAKAQQLGAREAGATDDADGDHSSSIRPIA